MARVHIARELRHTVIERARGCCEYCQSRADYATQSFDVEHIVPVSRGGTTELDNLALSCSGCNGHKYNRTQAPDPGDGSVVALFHPRHDTWQEHFRWNQSFTHIVGITPTGRATVEALRLNRKGLVNLRAVLYAAGYHPPE